MAMGLISPRSMVQIHLAPLTSLTAGLFGSRFAIRLLRCVLLAGVVFAGSAPVSLFSVSSATDAALDNLLPLSPTRRVNRTNPGAQGIPQVPAR